jgi:hypothetical protein
VLVQLVGVLHLATARHGVCWEHGVVVDLDAASRGVEAVAAPVGIGRAPFSVVRSDQHPHCPALWLLRQARLEVGSSTPVVASGPPRLVVTSPEPVAAPSGWALRQAPKHSPPV